MLLTRTATAWVGFVAPFDSKSQSWEEYCPDHVVMDDGITDEESRQAVLLSGVDAEPAQLEKDH